MPLTLHARLYRSSLIAHVCVPTLLLLGTEDCRIINVQGKAFFHALHALGSEVELCSKGKGMPSTGLTARVRWEASVD